MKIIVQLQPALVPELNVASAVEELRSLGTRNRLASRVRVSGGYDKGLYINVDYDSGNVKRLWGRLQRKLRADDRLAQCTIVCCQGKAGWDDYLLLHHFDSDVPLDELGADHQRGGRRSR